MKLNNKKRQSAVYSTQMINVYLRWLRGNKIRNGVLNKPLVLIPKVMQEMIKESWQNINDR